MALFGFGKDKRDGGNAETVYAYLEDAQRTRTALTVKDPNGKEASGLVQGLDEGAGTLSLQMSGPLVGAEKGLKVELVFMADSLRVGGPSRVLEVRPGFMTLELPEELGLRERRKQPRARLLPKEGATVTALTGLFEGVGITGNLENISETGARVRVDKAMNIKDQKKLPLGGALLPVGQELGILKLNKVPKCPPVIEISGKVVYAESTSSGLCLGIAFDKSGLTRPISGLVSTRGGSNSSSLPPKSRRRAPEPAYEAPVKAPAPSAAAAPAASTAAPAAPALTAAPAEAARPAEAPAAEGKPVAEAAPPRSSSPLLRLKKRARAVLIWGSQPLAGFLADHLTEDGYGKVIAIESLDELEPHLPLPNLGLIMVDREGPVLETLEGLGHLAEQLGSLPPVVLAADELSRPLVIAATRLGVTQLLVKPYALDEALSAMVEGQMGLQA